MTKQEDLFFARVALKMDAAGNDIEKACRMVLDDDIRILNTYSRLSDQKQSEFKRTFCDNIYREIHARKATS